MRFAPNEKPRSVFACDFPREFIGAVVVGHANVKVVGLTNVKFTIGILQQIDPELVTGKWLLR